MLLITYIWLGLIITGLTAAIFGGWLLNDDDKKPRNIKLIRNKTQVIYRQKLAR